MMRLNPLSVFIYLMILLVNPIQGQNLEKDFQAIHETYLTHPFLSFKPTYTFYDDTLANAVVVDKLQGEVKRRGYCLYTNLAGIETIQNEQFTLVVNHEVRDITLSARTKKAFEWEDHFYFDQLKSFLDMSSGYAYRTNGIFSRYDLFIKEGKYAKIAVHFDSRTHFIHKLVFYYRYPQMIAVTPHVSKSALKMEVFYSDINVYPIYAVSEFSEQKYLTKKQNNFVCKPTFKYYELKLDENVLDQL